MDGVERAMNLYCVVIGAGGDSDPLFTEMRCHHHQLSTLQIPFKPNSSPPFMSSLILYLVLLFSVAQLCSGT